MKFKTYNNNITVNGIRQGFTLGDSVSLRRETDHNPKIQTFTFEDLEEPAEERTYWCTVCKSRLVYLSHSDTIWRCDNCLSYYDTKIQDTPIKDKSEFKLFAHSEHDPYATMDVDDPNLPFLEGIDVNKGVADQNEAEVLRRTQDQRIQHIHIRGSFADAIRKGALAATNRKTK
jgi:hypothetical protein